MPNAIKYSTNAQTLALKKGNYWIGTGDVGKGPTSSTDYWNGITPPTGGYTIYLNKASNGPSIYTPSNDSQLITITNRIAGASYTTINECFNYFNGQSDKMVVNRDVEGIVTNGLQLYVDAGFIPSYPRNGTTWTDLSGNGNNGTLTNGPTFNSDNGGSIVFDGSNDYVDITRQLYLANAIAFSFSCWMKRATSSGLVLMYQGNGPLQDVSISLWNDGFAYFEIGNGSETYGYVANNSSNWQFLAMVYDGSLTGNSNRLKGWVNNTQQTLLYEGTIPSTSGQANSTCRLGSFLGTQGGNISIFQAYNRALNSIEVTQNYNAQKARFGL
jgi:hypothetical protein